VILRNYQPDTVTMDGCFINRVYGTVEVLTWTAKGKKIKRRRIYKNGFTWFFDDTDKSIPSHKLHDLKIDLPF